MRTIRLISATYVLSFILSILPVRLFAQSSAILAVQDSASLEAQLDFLQQKTRVYDNFRAIREDVFLKMKINTIDSLQAQKLEIARLKGELEERNYQIQSLDKELTRTREERDEAIRTKDSFRFFGLQVQKGVYNMIMWIIVVGLLAAGIILFLLFKRNHLVTTGTRKELEMLQEEYEEYRKSSREKYEKLVVTHHNEIMKLKRS